MKKIYYYIVCCSFCLSTTILAEDVDNQNADPYAFPNVSDYRPGIYLGAALGTTNMHYRGSSYLINNNTYDEKYKIADRACVGYSFSQFIATELGYNYYGRPKFNQPPNTQTIHQHGLDLSLKASLPLDYGFGFYVKGGLALIARSALHSNNGAFANKEANKKVTPLCGLGINYWFAPHIALDLSYTKTLTMSDLPTTDFFALGILYKLNI